MNIDSFDLSLLSIIKKDVETDEEQLIPCDESMLSADDLAKLKTVGTHTITINVPYYTVPVFVKFTITLYENEEITYTYQLDLGYLRDEVLIDDFDLSLIIIKEIDSKGNVKNIECNESMLSSADLAKLQTVGTHKIVINYQDFSAEVTINLIEINSSGGNEDISDVFKSTLSYYSSANGLKGTELKNKLRTIITNTHKKTTTYAELKTYLQKADEDPNNPNNMLLFYTAESVKKTNNMNIWNREHVWAQSLTGGWFGTSGAGADMHHLRPCDPGVNSSRGNKKFGTASGYYDPSILGADYRGDVARIIFYMFTRYTQADKFTFTAIAQSKEILLEWNKIDPVSATETIRNDYTYTIQGNRNPFIDHPECADLIWGTTSLLNNNGEVIGYVFNVVMFIDEKRKYEYV
jgi:endonuclease I